MNNTINKSVFIAASRETVWAYLTQKDKIALWFHQADADFVEGKEYRFTHKGQDDNPVIWGKIITMDAPNKLVYTFAIEQFGEATTTVTCLLEEAITGTKLSLIHEGIAEATGPMATQLLAALDSGWDEHLDDFRQSVSANQ